MPITNERIGGGGGETHTQNTDTNLGTIPSKDPPLDADMPVHRDSADSSKIKTSTWAQVKAFFRSSYDTVYSALSHNHDAAYSAIGHSHSDLNPAHKDATTGVHGVGAGTIAKTSDIPSKVLTITFVIDGAGSAITTGQKGHLEIPFACTINQVTSLADVSGSIVVDIWKDTYANFAPTDADSITASAPPTITSAQKSQDSTLTGWTTSITAGDVLAFNVDSCTTITRLTISLKVTKA